MKTEKNQSEKIPQNGKNDFQYMSLSGAEETASRCGETAENEPVFSCELLTDDRQKPRFSVCRKPIWRRRKVITNRRTNRQCS